MQPEVSLKYPQSVRITLLTAITLFVSAFVPAPLFAEETELSNIKTAGVSWGRKYFFDAPRFRDSTVQKQLDEAISQKLKTYGINLSEGNANSKYVLNYTILLGDTASQSDIEELYAEEPELKENEEQATDVEQGKLLISIRDRKTYKPIWKNTVEDLAILEMTDDEIRQQRVKTLVDQAFATFPVEPKTSK